jgi:Na+/H+-dicarboxylate symporter
VTSGLIFLTSFIALVIGMTVGMVLRPHIVADRLDASTKEVIRLGAGFLATLSAVLSA